MWTVVQHTGFAIGGESEFKRAVESRQVPDSKTASAVARAGGKLFDSYGEAEDFAEDENYPLGAQGLIPRATGSFSLSCKVDGLAVYIPMPTA